MKTVSAPDRRGQWIDAAPFRAHVRHSATVADVPWQVLAIVAGAPLSAVRTLLFGRAGRLPPRIAPRLASRLFQVCPADLLALHGHLTGATLTAEWLQDTLAAGVQPLRLARWCRLSATDLALLVDGDVTRCSRLTEALALAAHRQVRCRPEQQHRPAA